MRRAPPMRIEGIFAISRFTEPISMSVCASSSLFGSR